MTNEGRCTHWQATYADKGEAGVSWFEDRSQVSLDIIRQIGATSRTALIDVGGGASRLVDALVDEGWNAITVLDLSEIALGMARARLGNDANIVEWVVADVTKWVPTGTFDIWHDRAAFHFLTEPRDRTAYVVRLRTALKSGGYAIIATFAPDGPEHCSGLPVMRYDAATLAGLLGPSFELTSKQRYMHTTPSGVRQAFQYSVMRHVKS